VHSSLSVLLYFINEMAGFPNQALELPEIFGVPCDQLYLIILAVASGVCGMVRNDPRVTSRNYLLFKELITNVRDEHDSRTPD
jgi:hypothetical protein